MHEKLSEPNWSKRSSSSALLDAARRARGFAYSPYSKLRVGAAVKDDRGHITLGVNVENASYGLTCCAERVAIFSAIASGAKQITELAVAGPMESSQVADILMPCGACLQVMREFMDQSGVVSIDGVGTLTLNDLLPHPYGLKIKNTSGI
jgi:cytidine deaminase